MGEGVLGLGNLIYTAATWIIPLILAIVFHEIAHGYVANLLGDPTAAERGRLSLNPVRHVDPVGTVALPLMLAVLHAPVFGWAKPVPVITERLRNPRLDMMLVALAGPLSNLFMAVLAAGALSLMPLGPDLADGDTPVLKFLVDNLVNFLWVNALLAVFNLIPLPPFDGGHVVKGLLPRSVIPQYENFERYGLLVMVTLVLILPMLSPQLNVLRIVVAPLALGIMQFLLWSVGLA